MVCIKKFSFKISFSDNDKVSRRNLGKADFGLRVQLVEVAVALVGVGPPVVKFTNMFHAQLLRE